MKPFTLSLVLLPPMLLLGAASAAGQTLSGPALAVTATPASEKEASLEAASPKNGSQDTAGETEHPRIATRPPTPLVRK